MEGKGMSNAHSLMVGLSGMDLISSGGAGGNVRAGGASKTKAQMK